MTTQEEIMRDLNRIAMHRSRPFCYTCYKTAPSGRCTTCGSDDLMREVPGVGVEYGTSWIVPHVLEESEVSPIDEEAAFQEYMEEAFSEPVTICGMEYDQIHALKELDPVAYRCAMADWLSAEEGETHIEIIAGAKAATYPLQELQDWIEEQLDAIEAAEEGAEPEEAPAP